jgi:acyl-CoA synthetase (AMP-forming)/AMP-acid ligase II
VEVAASRPLPKAALEDDGRRPGGGLASKHPGEECMPKLTQSYVHGVSMTPLIGETVGVHFDKVAARFADRDALIVRQQNVRWTYGELKEKTDALAAGLLALGLSPGDRVGIWSPNNAEWVITQFATAKAGLILVNINPAYRLSELDYALNKVGCKALITADNFKTSDYVGMLWGVGAERERKKKKKRPARAAAVEAPAGAHHAHSYRR